MNDFDQINHNSDENNANRQDGSNEQSYNYTGNQIIQDSVYSQQSDNTAYQPNYTDRYSQQQYTYQSPRSDYSQSGYNYNYNTYQSGQQTYSAPETNSAQPSASSVAAKRRGASLGVVILCAFLAAVISSAASIGIMSTFVNKDKKGESVNTTQLETTIISSNLEMSTVEAVAKAVTPSVVCIEVEMEVQNNYGYFYGGYNSGTYSATSYGSGVVYSTDGYIITNYHVISGVYESSVKNAKIKVYLGNDRNDEVEAAIVGYNSAADLAVLKVEKTGLTAMKIGDSDKLVLGQTVVAIGNPGGIDFAGSVTSGIISGLDRELSVDSVTMTLIQTDAAINPGNSGGALVDATGHLVGIPNVKITADGYEGMGFCIPVNTAVEICNDIIENGMDEDRTDGTPYLGIEMNTGFSGGAYVARVTDGGPAAEGGIKSGDVIISFGDAEIKSHTDLIDALEKYKPGDRVKVGIYRNGNIGSVTVTLGSNGN